MCVWVPEWAIRVVAKASAVIWSVPESRAKMPSMLLNPLSLSQGQIGLVWGLALGFERVGAPRFPAPQCRYRVPFRRRVPQSNDRNLVRRAVSEGSRQETASFRMLAV